MECFLLLPHPVVFSQALEANPSYEAAKQLLQRLQEESDKDAELSASDSELALHPEAQAIEQVYGNIAQGNKLFYGERKYDEALQHYNRAISGQGKLLQTQPSTSQHSSWGAWVWVWVWVCMPCHAMPCHAMPCCATTHAWRILVASLGS